MNAVSLIGTMLPFLLVITYPIVKKVMSRYDNWNDKNTYRSKINVAVYIGKNTIRSNEDYCITFVSCNNIINIQESTSNAFYIVPLPDFSSYFLNLL